MKQFGPVVFLILTSFAGTAAGQAMVGYGLGAAGAAIGTSPAAGIGKAIGKAWESAGKTTNTAKTASSTAIASSAAKAKPEAAAHHEDLAKIEAGIAYTDLVRRFGRPSMEITGDDGTRTLTYLGKPSSAELVLRGEKVESVDIRR